MEFPLTVRGSKRLEKEVGEEGIKISLALCNDPLYWRGFEEPGDLKLRYEILGPNNQPDEFPEYKGRVLIRGGKVEMFASYPYISPRRLPELENENYRRRAQIICEEIEELLAT
ncbi:hypothetical protein D6829_00855 [Candidatus Pacearchaeota archaeon]|nr:MAG: hypothetical protein D6829_00855 [Candidatus Pacearchaeota archaeon]